jgi:predicted RNA methylase
VLINLFFFIGLIFAIILLSWIWPPDSPWSPRWRTDKKIARAAFRLVKLSKKDIVYELGSGGATALLVASEEFGAKGVGIEIEPLRFNISKFNIWRKKQNKNIKLIRGNFFEKDLSRATILYVYLVPQTLNRLLPKLRRELKKGTPIISYKYEMNLPLKKIDKKNELRYYVLN